MEVLKRCITPDCKVLREEQRVEVRQALIRVIGHLGKPCDSALAEIERAVYVIRGVELALLFLDDEAVEDDQLWDAAEAHRLPSNWQEKLRSEAGANDLCLVAYKKLIPHVNQCPMTPLPPSIAPLVQTFEQLTIGPYLAAVGREKEEVVRGLFVKWRGVPSGVDEPRNALITRCIDLLDRRLENILKFCFGKHGQEIADAVALMEEHPQTAPYLIPIIEKGGVYELCMFIRVAREVEPSAAILLAQHGRLGFSWDSELSMRAFWDKGPEVLEAGFVLRSNNERLLETHTLAKAVIFESQLRGEVLFSLPKTREVNLPPRQGSAKRSVTAAPLRRQSVDDRAVSQLLADRLAREQLRFGDVSGEIAEQQVILQECAFALAMADALVNADGQIELSRFDAAFAHPQFPPGEAFKRQLTAMREQLQQDGELIEQIENLPLPIPESDMGRAVASMMGEVTHRAVVVSALSTLLMRPRQSKDSNECFALAPLGTLDRLVWLQQFSKMAHAGTSLRKVTTSKVRYRDNPLFRALVADVASLGGNVLKRDKLIKESAIYRRLTTVARKRYRAYVSEQIQIIFYPEESSAAGQYGVWQVHAPFEFATWGEFWQKLGAAAVGEESRAKNIGDHLALPTGGHAEDVLNELLEPSVQIVQSNPQSPLELLHNLASWVAHYHDGAQQLIVRTQDHCMRLMPDLAPQLKLMTAGQQSVDEMIEQWKGEVMRQWNRALNPDELHRIASWLQQHDLAPVKGATLVELYHRLAKATLDAQLALAQVHKMAVNLELVTNLPICDTNYHRGEHDQILTFTYHPITDSVQYHKIFNSMEIIEPTPRWHCRMGGWRLLLI